MAQRQKPRVTTNCVANTYAGPDERIIEVTMPNGIGCLISIRYDSETGTAIIAPYRLDPGIVVVGPAGATTTESAA